MSVFRAVLRACCVLVVFAAPVEAQEPSKRGLTLMQAIQRALAANPRLTAAERDVGIATGQRIQAGAIPNPELSADVDNVLGSREYRGFRAAETTLQISQLIEMGGKREARIAAGVAGINTAAWQREAVRLEVASETASAFVAVLGLQRRINILVQQVVALDGLTPLLQRRVEAGASSPAETMRAKVAANLVRVELVKTRTALSTARRELAILMGDNAPTFGLLAGLFQETRHPPPFRFVLDAIEGNPQLMRWTAVRAQRSAELLIARLKPIPDVRVAAGWKHFRDTGDNAATFGLSIALPVWDQNQGDILSARDNLRKVEAERKINKAILLSIAGRAYDTITGALQELDLLRTTVLPDSRQATRAIQDGYAQGRFTLLELLDAQSAVTEAALREQEALQSFHTAVTTLEGLIGRPFSPIAESRRR